MNSSGPQPKSTQVLAVLTSGKVPGGHSSHWPLSLIRWNVPHSIVTQAYPKASGPAYLPGQLAQLPVGSRIWYAGQVLYVQALFKSAESE
jgi:hypothetical protein